MRKWLYGTVVLIMMTSVLAKPKDPFLTEKYDKLHDSAMQQKFRKIAPIPVGCVLIMRPGEGEKELRWHFRTMKELGFTCTKQIQVTPEWTFEDVALIALEEGIIPWWYGEGGWEAITDDLLKALNIPINLSNAEIRKHPQMQAYQNKVQKDRVLKMKAWKKEGKPLRIRTRVPDIGGIGPELTDEGKEQFVLWVKETYKNIDDLNFAWNQHHYGTSPGEYYPFVSWDDFDERWEQVDSKEYRHVRDIFRFKADQRIKLVKTRMKQHFDFDEHHPFRAGGEMGMFLPFSYRGVDMEGIAETLINAGSFYPSIHLAWHFDEVNHEIPRPHYTQAALTHDYFKGGWSATWESTGGPQQFSGGKGGNDFTVDAGTMTQLMLNYLAAGYKGFGFWSWSARTAGWEAGEYSLLDRHNKVTKRAIQAGKIGKTARKYRDELWAAHKEPLVGVYVDWENEAIWAAMSVRGRDHFRQDPINARVGVSRALINANVPFEYVTASDIRNGLSGRYPVIYMPKIVAIPKDIMTLLSQYVKAGGRLVMDMPSAYYDEYGALMYTDKGTDFEKTFGITIGSYQGAGVNVPYWVNGLEVNGLIADMTVSSAKVLHDFDNGNPAITENTYGRGTAVILGFEASAMCFKPGADDYEALLLEQTLGMLESPYACEKAIVYRLAAPDADHYFFINDGPGKSVKLDVKDFKYKICIDALTDTEIDLENIALDRYSGRWIRCHK